MDRLAFRIAALLTCTFAFIGILQFYPQLSALDQAVGQTIYARNAVLIAIGHAQNWLGSGYGCVAMVALLCWALRRRDRWAALGLFTAMMASWLLNTLIKNHMLRERPDFSHLVYASGYSLPSGHAMAALTLSGALAIIASRHWPHYRVQWWSLAVIWTLSSGASRLVLGVHYFTDVMAGFLLAAALLIVFHWRYTALPQR